MKRDLVLFAIEILTLLICWCNSLRLFFNS